MKQWDSFEMALFLLTLLSEGINLLANSRERVAGSSGGMYSRRDLALVYIAYPSRGVLFSVSLCSA